MRVSDIFVGAQGKSILPLIKNSTVVGVYEISSSAEIPKKIEEIKKLVSKHPSTNQFIIVFK